LLFESILCKNFGIVFSTPEGAETHETIRYGSCACLRPLNLDPGGRYADDRQVRATATAPDSVININIEHVTARRTDADYVEIVLF
jgi:hypothetical protein